MRESLQEYCKTHYMTALLAEWDYEKNTPLTPETVSYGSQRAVWWRCERGHVWFVPVKRRTNGSGCPFCTKKQFLTGVNDLATTHPELAAQWHPTLNEGLRPDQLFSRSKRKVWWLCDKGHSYQATVTNRVDGRGCPVCNGKTVCRGYNDLSSKFPLIASQWHPEKNGRLTPDKVSSASNRRVWWLCEKGHDYQAEVGARTVNGAGCPYCSGRRVWSGFNDLETLEPALAAQWHPSRNGALRPADVTPGSNRKVWWLCEKGHAYQVSPGARVSNGSGCPYCAGRNVWPGYNDLATLEPQIAAQWHPTLNEPLRPTDVTTGSHRRVWWQCPDGHVWQAVIYSRAGKNKRGCPICAGKIKQAKIPKYRDGN